MNRIRISAVIITSNEEDNIAAAIDSVGFADQIVVADSSSTDDTVRIARETGAEVYDIPFDGFGAAKNKALEFCRGDWIFSLDADERVSSDLVENIIKAIKDDNKFDCYAVNRLSYFLGKPVRHSGWFPDYVVRLFRRGLKFSESRVHESVETNGEIGRLGGYLHHYSYRNLDQYIDKLNVYTRLNAVEMYERGRNGRLIDLFIHPVAVFLKMYIFKAGFLDGKIGFILAVLSSYHVFVKYAKLRQLTIKDER